MANLIVKLIPSIGDSSLVNFYFLVILIITKRK